jgi:hypothetical protein
MNAGIFVQQLYASRGFDAQGAARMDDEPCGTVE